MIDLALKTAAGYWAPLVWLAAFLIALAIALIIRSRGNSRFKQGKEQATPFFSGNKPPEENISGSNFYWGFFSATGKYYGWLRKLHTGIVNDYVFCLVLLVIFLLLAAALGGGMP